MLHREKDKNRVSDACIPCCTPGNWIALPPSTVPQSIHGKYAWICICEIFPHQEKCSVTLFSYPILHWSCLIFPLTAGRPNSWKSCTGAFTAAAPHCWICLPCFQGMVEYSYYTQLTVSRIFLPIHQTSAVCWKLLRLNTVCHRNNALGAQTKISHSQYVPLYMLILASLSLLLLLAYTIMWHNIKVNNVMQWVKLQRKYKWEIRCFLTQNTA